MQCLVECLYTYAINNNNRPNQCGNSTTFRFAGGIFHCPTTIDCESCNLLCKYNYTCRGATLYSYHCKNVTIDIEDGFEAARFLTIYGPDNDGSLFVNTTNIVPGGFRDAQIYSNETGKIQVDCYSNTAIDGNECSGLQIFGQDASYVEVNCKNNTNCQELDIYCPIDSSLNTQLQKSNPYPYSCVLTANDAQIVDGNITVASSSWNTYLNIPTFTCDNCDITIYCNNNKQDSCTMTQSGITNVCNATQGSGTGCLDATNFPSIKPTIYPIPSTTKATTTSINSNIDTSSGVTTNTMSDEDNDDTTAHENRVLTIMLVSVLSGITIGCCVLVIAIWMRRKNLKKSGIVVETDLNNTKMTTPKAVAIQ